MSPPDDAWLENLLRQGLKRPPLPDNGFTVRVLDALSRRQGFALHRLFLPLAWTVAVAGAAEGLENSGAWNWLAGAWPEIVRSTCRSLVDPWMCVVWVAVIGSLLMAWWSARSIFET